MTRNILLITTDQMRYDALGCNGGKIANTKNIDQLSSDGINYQRAHNQNVVCMPARATIMTGQHVRSHGVLMNGMSMPAERHTIAHHLKEHGYNTALLGKAHFEPWLGSPKDFFENRMASENSTGPHRGFDHMELANHFFEGHSHYDKYMDAYPEEKKAFYPMVTNKGQNTASKGATGATQVWPMDIPREIYHTDWVALRTKSWLDKQSGDKPWFCWMSFPDPHHPWDIPASELHRINWRDVPLPRLYSENRSQLESWLNEKPAHWRGYFDGSLWTNLESPREFVPAKMTADQVREINTMAHIENELIDEAVGDVIGFLHSKQWMKNTDIFFTTDHGELQGDFGLLFKGPYHVDALMHLPFIWKPAETANITSAEVVSPVGHIDLASTFCAIAGISPPDYCEGKPLPSSESEAVQQGREIVLTEWDSEHGPIDMHLKSIYHRDGFLCTAYEKSHLYDGTEGELYDMKEDPDQLKNLWNDPGYASHRVELTNLLYASLPEETSQKLDRKAPV
jgi:arylsulfatase A-like enzyme